MGRGQKNPAGHRCGTGNEGHGLRGNDNPCDPMCLEDDPCRDMRDPGENLPEPGMEDYLWPEYEEEDDD